MGDRGAISPCKWGSVDIKAERVAIIATGPSAERLDQTLLPQAAAKGVHIIAVNGAIDWLVTAHSWFTVDPGPYNRPRMANQRSGVRYFAAIPDDYGCIYADVYLHRAPPENNVTWLRRMSERTIIPGAILSNSPDTIRSGNSAFGALNMAYLMGAKKVALIGVDGTRARYAFTPGRPIKRLTHLPRLFRLAKAQLDAQEIEVRNGSPLSIVTSFKRCRPNEAIEWVMR